MFGVLAAFFALVPMLGTPVIWLPAVLVLAAQNRWGAALYPARTQLAYKLKWAPDRIEREYVAARPLSPRAVFDFLRLTRSL